MTKRSAYPIKSPKPCLPKSSAWGTVSWGCNVVSAQNRVIAGTLVLKKGILTRTCLSEEMEGSDEKITTMLTSAVAAAAAEGGAESMVAAGYSFYEEGLESSLFQDSDSDFFDEIMVCDDLKRNPYFLLGVAKGWEELSTGDIHNFYEPGTLFPLDYCLEREHKAFRDPAFLIRVGIDATGMKRLLEFLIEYGDICPQEENALADKGFMLTVLKYLDRDGDHLADVDEFSLYCRSVEAGALQADPDIAWAVISIIADDERIKLDGFEEDVNHEFEHVSALLKTYMMCISTLMAAYNTPVCTFLDTVLIVTVFPPNATAEVAGTVTARDQRARLGERKGIPLLQKLNAHGPHFAQHFKKMIAAFAGVPCREICPQPWSKVTRAAIKFGLR